MNFDLDRMQEALSSKVIEVPKGLSIEEKLAYILGSNMYLTQTSQIEVNLNNTIFIAKYSFNDKDFEIDTVHVLLHNYESSDIMELLSDYTLEQIEKAIKDQGKGDCYEY